MSDLPEKTPLQQALEGLKKLENFTLEAAQLIHAAVVADVGNYDILCDAAPVFMIDGLLRVARRELREGAFRLGMINRKFAVLERYPVDLQDQILAAGGVDLLVFPEGKPPEILKVPLEKMDALQIAQKFGPDGPRDAAGERAWVESRRTRAIIRSGSRYEVRGKRVRFDGRLWFDFAELQKIIDL